MATRVNNRLARSRAAAKKRRENVVASHDWLYDENTKTFTKRDVNGNEFTADNKNRLIKEVFATGKEKHYFYDDPTYPLRVSEVDGSNIVFTKTRSDGVIEVETYKDNVMVTRSINGIVSTFNKNGVEITRTDVNGEVWTVEGSHGPVKLTNRRGDVVHQNIDGSYESAEERAEYWKNAARSRKADDERRLAEARAQVPDVTYYPKLTKQMQDLFSISDEENDDTPKVRSRRDEEGNTTYFDRAGRAMYKELESGGTVTYRYYEEGELREERRPEGRVTRFERDGSVKEIVEAFTPVVERDPKTNRVLREVSEFGDETKFTYKDNICRATTTSLDGEIWLHQWIGDDCTLLRLKRLDGSTYSFNPEKNEYVDVDKDGVTTTVTSSDEKTVTVLKDPNKHFERTETLYRKTGLHFVTTTQTDDRGNEIERTYEGERGKFGEKIEYDYENGQAHITKFDGNHPPFTTTVPFEKPLEIKSAPAITAEQVKADLNNPTEPKPPNQGWLEQ
jgi:YD repeat-containing protein